jgi:hypothetical protein
MLPEPVLVEGRPQERNEHSHRKWPFGGSTRLRVRWQACAPCSRSTRDPSKEEACAR